jgi:hypothetical protein
VWPTVDFEVHQYYHAHVIEKVGSGGGVKNTKEPKHNSHTRINVPLYMGGEPLF